jgi:hypothetical protein
LDGLAEPWPRLPQLTMHNLQTKNRYGASGKEMPGLNADKILRKRNNLLPESGT